MNFNSNQDVIKVYNGTNHDVSIYRIDCDNFKSNRNCSSFKLINPQIQPYVTYEQRNVLDVKRIVPTPVEYLGTSFSLPDYIYPVERFDESENYDIIIVSRFYAENALKSNLPLDYIDRLYIVGTKVIDVSNVLLGNAGLQKVINPMNVWYYISAFENNMSPSIVSAKMCLYQHQSTNVQVDYATENDYLKLDRYITAEEYNRATMPLSTPVLQKVFNV